MLFQKLQGAFSGLPIAFRASATSLTSTITVPSGIQSGDILVLHDTATNATTIPTAVVPTGFTSILNEAFTTQRRTINSYKIANGTESGTTITGMNGANTNAKILLVFSAKANTVNVKSVNYQCTDADPTSQTITASAGRPALVAIGFIRNLLGNANTTMSPTEDGTVSLASVHYGYYKIYNQSPQNVTFDTNDGGTQNILISYYIEVA